MTDNVHEHQPGRILGVVLRDTTRTNGYVFLTDGSSIEYFAHKSGFATLSLFESIQVGKPVSFRVTKTTKGHRAHDVREADAAEVEQIAELIEDRQAAVKADAVRREELEGGRGRG